MPETIFLGWHAWTTIQQSLQRCVCRWRFSQPIPEATGNEPKCLQQQARNRLLRGCAPRYTTWENQWLFANSLSKTYSKIDLLSTEHDAILVGIPTFIVGRPTCWWGADARVDFYWWFAARGASTSVSMATGVNGRGFTIDSPGVKILQLFSLLRLVSKVRKLAILAFIFFEWRKRIEPNSTTPYDS